jgi:hypothetical protein
MIKVAGDSTSDEPVQTEAEDLAEDDEESE